MRPTPVPRRPQGALDLARYPNVYDAAFSWDRAREAETYLRVAKERRPPTWPRSVVELACGSGPLARRWASSVSTVYGVDRSLPSLAWARRASRGVIPSSHWCHGDLANFRLPERVDLAVVPLDGLTYLTEEEDFVSFFRSCRGALVPGGILATDVTLHRKGGRPFRVRNHWNVSLLPEGRLSVHWRSQGDPWGIPLRQWEVGRIALSLEGRVRQVFWEASPHATLTSGQLEGFAKMAGGFGRMVVYSSSAHRPLRTVLKRDPTRGQTGGPRLVVWTRGD